MNFLVPPARTSERETLKLELDSAVEYNSLALSRILIFCVLARSKSRLFLLI